MRGVSRGRGELSLRHLLLEPAVEEPQEDVDELRIPLRPRAGSQPGARLVAA